MIQKAYWEAVHITLGCMLKDKTEASQIFYTFRPEDFVEDDHRTIYEVGRALFNANEPITPGTIGAKTSDAIMDLCKQCKDYVLSAQDWTGYVSIIREQAAMSRAAPLAEQLSHDLVAAASIDDVRRQAEQIVGALDTGSNSKCVIAAKDLAIEFMTDLDRPVKYLDWGFDKLNQHVLCEGGEYIIIGARPSVGKTAFALQVGLHFAQKKRVGFFSLETDQKKVACRMFAAESMVDMDAIKHRNLSPEQQTALARAAGEISRKDFALIPAAGYTVEQIRRIAVAERMEIIIIDYLQLVCSQNPKQEEYARVSEVSRQLQLLAKELGITVIALSQLNRSVDKYTEPDPADLRSSGQIEQDADVILMLYLPDESELKKLDEIGDQEILRWLKIAKCKEGICGKIKFWFNGSVQRFQQTWPDFYETPVVPMPRKAAKIDNQQMQMRGDT